jgi:hypothetical protein
MKSVFNLLHLQEGEQYIAGYKATAKFFDPESSSHC